ncbi:glycosyltransferase family 25 protein [Psychrobacter sp. DAB_AL43B]|uniref:glycosyltransferase family 25 protein n=1 Tax=Psychrobacter sp. DAB_AL43B TaxID=1028416 RepID=UPI0009A63274|nr:glycosyltransferase family 25 protein [Psychrobacter sp. DAB_AL43B]SLJ84841.1 lipooligosaccharide biosynthesis protein [Psychrobacter sp. DAB_AL43B]
MKTITYLINLEGSHQRLESATKQLNQIEWPFERVSAYDGRGKNLSSFEDYDETQARKNLGRSLLSSEIGCYLSHYQCAKKFLQTDADFLVVLEDDMEMTASFKAIMDETLDYLATNPELDWYLINIAAKKKKLAKNITMFDDHSLWHAYYFPIRGLGLIWSRAGAEAFVAVGKTITMPVDIFFQRWLSGNGKGVGIWPALIKPLGLDSDILGTEATQNIKRKNKENRDLSYKPKKQKRMLQDKASAIKNLLTTN